MVQPRLRQKYDSLIRSSLQEKYKFPSTMRIPKIEKIILNVGMGDAHNDPKAMEACLEELSQITGQRAVKTIAKKSIAGFKLREGMVMGAKVTLRGSYMYEFLDRLINIALPRVRDFKGVSPKGFDGRGNFNMSVMEQIIFPEIQFDKVKKIYGINISIVTTAHKDEEAFDLLSGFGMPYRQKK